MEMTVMSSGGIQVIRLHGRLDVSSSPLFLERFKALPSVPTVLDMEELEYLSSAGLRALHIASKSVPKLAVANFGTFCKEIYKVSGFSSIVPQYETVEAAIAELI
jgi:anti-anti-sigma factor